ncbi:hypothetical protein HRbin17_01206 [bacterium HR17]|uniref:Uncharacterized protein n=1 Tax=Candidatus Fervidibacter japonicus TaxID=2035412 RepID=A0A2H5XBY1_9BACT|nr:hypothetical protein HRbin17_01206 [bacterium HR17]
MSELRSEVLQAEVAIRQLAEELARAKGVTEKVAIVERKLNEAAEALEQSCKALEGAQEELTRTAAQARLALFSASEENRKALEGARKSVQEMVAQAQASLNSAEKLLYQASNQLSQSSQAIASEVRQGIAEFGEQVQATLNNAIENLRRVSDQLSQSSQALSSSVGQAIKDFGERVRQTLQQAYQNMQEQLNTTIVEAQKALINAANSLTELQTGFERDVSALTQQNERMLQHIAQQDVEIKRLSKWLKFSLILSAFLTFTSIAVVILLLIRR